MTMQCLKCTFLLALLLIPEPTPAIKGDIVKTWARNLGEELWKLSESLTKSDQIRIKYKQMNASVKKKDGKNILESSLRSVGTMLTRKINAVKCIHATAEELAKNFDYEATERANYSFEYCSAKYSNFSFQYPEDEIESDMTEPEFLKKSRAERHYTDVSLEKDSHFYNISVNTNMSCVHVPTNIFYKEKNALNSILWSKGLDDVFINNYKSDPSLVWQYFGSAHGVLRFYPGMPWNRKHADIYDCRVQSWYIEAATCSKDVIILFDISGSMTGFKNYVARRTLSSLLDTLSNNDYVNVFHFKNVTGKAVECFENLVQATKENINTIRDTLEPTDEGKKHRYPLDGNANLTAAYIKAFDVLREAREKANCSLTSTTGCNQLVMVITDYVPGNLTEVFEEHNREVVDGKTYIPVRVFTYLIGKEVTNVREIQWMACLNRGYFVHIHSVEEVQQQVLKYINVIARPMILEGGYPEPTWTHANIDQTRTKYWSVSNDIKSPDEDKLVTSVAIPAFDYKSNEKPDSAMLLGVAGTDVPIDSISKLAQPHQLGVNGYSFIVSNNGYLLLHPLLTITINEGLLDNYNSVDFVEVEQVDDGKKSRELGPEIKELREKLVHGADGEMRDIKVLYHYDQMRRIARVKHDYFFHELKGTPFSMGISLPKKYGDTELLLKDNPLEAKQGQALTGINVTDYFRYTYRVHPDWVYCKYHYLEGHENVHPEHEIFKFLGNLSRNKLNITKKQYEFETSEDDNFSIDTHCGEALKKESRDIDDYYCNEDLVKQLVFDAKLTTPYFKDWDGTEEEKALAQEYNVSVRFVATSSGLTRWHYITDVHKNEKVLDDGMRVKDFEGEVFGDIYIRSIEETWYKAAVLQHSNNNNVESLVIATRLPILDEIIVKRPKVENDDGDITITASYAVFYKDGDSETPASVLGFEFLYSGFYDRFIKITESAKDWSEGISCTSSKYDCYVVDSSGYVVLSKDKTHVGQFFGVINKYVLKSLVDSWIFDSVEVFNYQALCPWWMRPEQNNSNLLFTPFTLIKNLLAWLFTEIVIMTSNLSYWSDNAYANVVVEDKDYFELYREAHTEAPTTAKPPPDTRNKNNKDDKPFSCDQSITLYILNQTFFLDGAKTGAIPLVSKDEAYCNPAYWATLVTKTNLLLVVVERTNRTYGGDCTFSTDTKPVVTEESQRMREPCHKLPLGSLTRKKLAGCFTYHEREKNITDCGLGHRIRGDTSVFLTTTVLAIAATKLFL